MFKKFKLLLLILGVSSFCVLAFNSVAFAEDDNPAGCSGVVSGNTIAMPAFLGIADEGNFDFNCHEQKVGVLPSCTSTTGINVSAAPELAAVCTNTDVCYAPSRSIATCIAPDPTTVDKKDKALKTFLLEGFAWNNNLGFTSFYCGTDGKNLGVDCGPISVDKGYGVKIGAVQNGRRYLTGYAWNPAFGWISFSGASASGSFKYKVSASMVNGNPNVWMINTDSADPVPYAYTNEGLWVNFDGIQFTLPGTDVVCKKKAQCCPAGSTTCCAEADCLTEGVTCDQFYVTAGLSEVDKKAKDDKCMGLNGVPYPYDAKGSICKCSKITVECSPDGNECIQIVPADGADADLTPSGDKPLADGNEGYNLYLLLKDANGPLNSADGFKVNFNSWTDTVKRDQMTSTPATAALNFNSVQAPFDDGKGGGVKYKPVGEILGTNMTYKDNVTIGSGDFGRFNIGKVASYVPTTEGNISWTEENSIFSMAPMKWQNEAFVEPPFDDFKAPPKNQLVLETVKITVPPGNDAKYIKTISVGAAMTFRPAITFDKLSQVILDPSVQPPTLDSIIERKDSIVGVNNIPADFYTKLFKKSGLNVSNLVIDMIFPGRGVSSTANCSKENVEINGSLAGSSPVSFPLDANPALKNAFTFGESNLSALISGDFFQATPKFTGDSCEFNKKESVYTQVQYEINGKKVQYYSNKLPKTFVKVANPSVNILGNVRAQKAAVTNTEVLKISAVGGQVVFKPEKGSLLANKASYGDFQVTGSSAKEPCSISALNDSAYTVDCPGSNYASKKDNSSGETVLYFKDADVTINLPGVSDADKKNYSGRYAIVVDGGNVYIKSDIYNSNAGKANQISLAVLSKDPGKDGNGNIYMDCTVRNTQFSAYLDNAIFQHFSDAANVTYNNTTGEPESAQLYFSKLMDSTEACNQWKHEGAFISYNTIGMTDKMIGRGYQPVDSKLKASLYDLNYERLVFATFAIDADGHIIDLSCGKVFDFEDYQNINDRKKVCAPKDLSSNKYQMNCLTNAVPGTTDKCDPTNQCRCDGINGSKIFNQTTNLDGDLLIPNLERSARGLKNEYAPANIFQGQNDSKLFKGLTTKTK